ncbi:MAG: diguanylate cyclase [Actinomycetota bacterium]|jgi:diguanylate cyclase (GGDEF)-like protein
MALSSHLVQPLTMLLGVAIGFALSHALRKIARPRRIPDETDTLTGVSTRAVGHAVLSTLRDGDAVAMIDLDTLKAVNDAHGHAAGDRDLVALATHLASGLRAGDAVARWGGDEFVVVLRGAGTAATNIVDRLRASSAVAFSAGVAVHRDGPGDQTLAAADAALLQAKRAGGSLVVQAEG